MERKEDTKARLGRSPDHADALLLAFYAPVVAASDPAFVYGTVPCARCGELYPWHPGGWCWHCGHPAPRENPFAERLAPLEGG